MKTINFHGHDLIVPDAVVKVKYVYPYSELKGYDADGHVIFEMSEELNLQSTMSQTYNPTPTLKDFPAMLKKCMDNFKEVIYFGMPLMVRKEVKCIATDADGCVAAYTEKPDTGDYGWYSPTSKRSTLFYIGEDIPFWKETLQEYM